MTRISAEGQLDEEALETAQRIAANGPVAVRAAKQAIDRGMDATLSAGLAIEAECYELVIPTSDRLEALAAFGRSGPRCTGGSRGGDREQSGNHQGSAKEIMKVTGDW